MTDIHILPDIDNLYMLMYEYLIVCTNDWHMIDRNVVVFDTMTDKSINTSKMINKSGYQRGSRPLVAEKAARFQGVSELEIFHVQKFGSQVEIHPDLR